MIAKAIDLLVHVELFMDGCRRVTAVSQICYDEKERKINIKDIFRYNQTGMSEDGELIGQWDMDQTMPEFMEKLHKRMINLPDGFFKD